MFNDSLAIELSGMASSIAFGLMASTVLVLLVIPCLYTILSDLGLVSAVKRGGIPDGESGPPDGPRR